MNREFEYSIYKFNIEVDFETGFEKDLNNVGEITHSVTIKATAGSNYYKTYTASDKYLIDTINVAEYAAMLYVDNSNSDDTHKGTLTERLKELGFK